MTWTELLRKFEAMPLFHSSLLEIFPDDLNQIRVQLSRWVKAGKLVRIRREWYLIERPWRTREVPHAYVATQIVRPCYLSLEWALEFHGLIPEAVENPTCATTDRPRIIRAMGRSFFFHHLQPELLTGFGEVLMDGWPTAVASAEKALFDSIYFRLHRRRFSLEWLAGLRLQNLEAFDSERFHSFAEKSQKAGLAAAVTAATEFIERERA